MLADCACVTAGITEIAIVIHNGVEVTGKYVTLINPRHKIPPFIVNMTGISDEMVAAAPLFEDVAPQIYNLLNGRVFVAHNVSFDYSFVHYLLGRSGFQWSAPKLCTIKLSRRVFPGLEKYGSEEQKVKYLTPLAKGDVIGAFCLSEPEAGSDATSQRTTAIDMGDHYLVNGTKNWITNGGTASTYLVIAQTDASKGHKGINVLIVEKGMPGFEVGPKEKKMGIRGSDTHTLLFNDVKVPKENRIGADGFGFAFAMSTLNGGRIGIASQALGIAQGAYELALKYSQERVAFGKPIFNHQAIAFKLADMHVKITCARLLIHKAATEKDNGEDIAHSGAMAKLYASEIALEVANEAVQIHGGNGYVSEYHVERMMRDSKITQIYEGTSEIQRIVISRGLVKK